MLSRTFAHRIVRQAATLLLALGFALCLAEFAQACPQCQKALAGSDGGVGGNIVRGYFWSILFMLSMPFVLLSAFSTYFYLLIRKAQKNPAPVGPAVLAARQGVAPAQLRMPAPAAT